MSDPKRSFLVGYDYGTGGLWGVVLARSEAEIKAMYPELVIVHERPKWMTDASFRSISEEWSHDIDGAPWGLLNVVLADREERERGNE